MTISDHLNESIRQLDASFINTTYDSPPSYDPLNHYKDLAKDNYYRKLLIYRHIVKQLCDEFMSAKLNAINVDLFMLTPSVSSPMGPGSDSEALPIMFGELESYLTDSSQFGFEPLLMNGLDRCYCYLPSMRGEDPDARHLNQFYHCEIEICGGLSEVMDIAESFVKYLCNNMKLPLNILRGMCSDYESSKLLLERAGSDECFQRIEFDKAVDVLVENGHKQLVNFTDHGRDISSQGELKLLEILKINTPLWIVRFDRDRVPFYQKPDPSDNNKVLNADLIFPPVSSSGFGGEILGAGQRQDNSEQMYSSLERQGLSSQPYEWYIELRNDPRYSTTSGFGLGIERLISWAIGLDNIRDAIIYPRLKNILTTP